MSFSGFDFEDKTIFVRSREQDVSPWDKTKIIAILMDESGIPFEIAEKIADDVQKIVFASGIKTVSSSLLRELVNSKLIEYGYSRILNKTRRLGLSTSDVKDILFFPVPYKNFLPDSPFSSSVYISETVKRQYAAFNVFPEKLVNTHYQGRFHINGINGIDRLYSVCVDCKDLLFFSYTGDNFFIEKPADCRDFFKNLLKITVYLYKFVNYSVDIVGVEKALKYFDCEGKGVELIKEFADLAETALLSEMPVRLFLKNPELVKGCADFYKKGFYLKSEVVADVKSFVPSRNVSLYGREKEKSFIVENVTLNLPGIALDSKMKGGEFFKELKKKVEEAFSVFSKKGLFLEKVLMKKGRGVFDFLKKIGFNPLVSRYVVSFCGLQECVSLIREKAKFNSADMDFAFEIISALKEFIEELSEKHKIKAVLGDSDQGDSAYRFARLDLKFDPYFIGKIVKGDISSGGVYYSHNGSFFTNKFLEFKEALEVEERVKSFFAYPFKTVVRVIDFDKVELFFDNFSPGFLMLTQDFSVCYHCNVMKSGLYKTCPECLDGNIVNYCYLYSNYSPFSKLNRGLTVMMKNSVYYEEFTI